MNRRIAIVSALVLSFGFAASAVRADWKISAKNTKIQFVGSKKNGKHDGGFKQFSGTVTAPKDITNTKIKIEIKTASLYSDNGKLTRHLKSPDFFDVRNKPKATFVSTKIAKGSDGKYKITGNLTLLGKTKSISFPASINVTGGSLKLQSSFSIDRTDFGMNYAPGRINDQVKVKVSVNASN